MKKRISLLRCLRAQILARQHEICVALSEDIGKSSFESAMTEILMVTEHISYVCRHLKRWSEPERVRSAWYHFPSRCEIRHEPLGRVLIFSAWNYPFQLALLPVIGAYAAGNRVLLKPSETAPATSALLESLIGSVFSRDEVTVQQGGAETAEELLRQKWELIFFTGSEKIGRIVAKAAAEHMTPAVLEMGGKSPCIVNRDADLAVTARRIAWGKWLNAGQTCVAPDYLLVHAEVKDKLLDLIRQSIRDFYGDEPIASPDYARIVNRQHFDRLCRLAEPHQIVCDAEKLKIAPLILPDPSADSPVMQEEIFGPVLPVLTFEQLDEAIAFVQARPASLALYYFGNERKDCEYVLSRTRSGTVAINDCVVQIGNESLPFGGIGESGMGKYHGKYSFLTFTHARSVMRKGVFPDIPFRYPPCSRWKQQLLRWLLR